jgi:hypothetical protein
VPLAATISKSAAPALSELDADYVAPGRPAAFTDLTRGWPATERWSFDYLAQRYGAARVELAQLQRAKLVFDWRGMVRRSHALGAWLEARGRGEAPGYAIAARSALPPELQGELPPPEICAAASFSSSKLWLSPAGTVSALHFDITDNLHSVVLGAKRFTLFSPADWRRVYAQPFKSPLLQAAAVDPEAPDLERFPRFAQARALTVDLLPGETIFIPRFWWHHVRTLADCASVNWWWANGPWSLAARASRLVKRLANAS